jgi:16S rRNA (cytosine1402-N4)-methyltransferase
MAYQHTPAMPQEVLHYLDCRPGGTYIDGTLGGAGHAALICEKIAPDGLLIGIDQDPEAVEHAHRHLKYYRDILRLFHGSFTEVPQFLKQLGIGAADGILLDLGLSRHHLEESGRGFSFQRDEPLDMRMDVRRTETAAQIVNSLTAEALGELFRTYGEERHSKKIARGIVAARERRPITTSKQLADIVCAAVSARERRAQQIHPATRVFMALRIAVNRELDCIREFMAQVDRWLNPGGRLCVLAFHSLEDRIVKQHLKQMAAGCICPPQLPVCGCGHDASMRILTKKAVRPSAAEVAANPMARSTRLRAAERIAP